MSRLFLVLVVGLSIVLGGCGAKEEASAEKTEKTAPKKSKKKSTMKQWISDFNKEGLKMRSRGGYEGWKAALISLFDSKFKGEPFKLPVTYTEGAFLLLTDVPEAFSECRLRPDPAFSVERSKIDCYDFSALEFDIEPYKYDLKVDCIGKYKEVVADQIRGFNLKIKLIII